MTLVLIIARVVLVAVFAVAGLAKLADRAGAREALRGFGVPGRAVGGLAIALPLGELAIAAALIPSATAPAGALAALGLLAVFAAAIARAVRAGQAPDCHCFGALHAAPAGRATLVRNAVLGLVAAGVAAAALAGETPSLVAWVGDVSGAAAVAVGGAVVVAVVLAGGGWLAVELLRQNGRLLERVDALEAAAGADRFDVGGSAAGADRSGVRGPAAGPPTAPRPAPDVALTTLDGAPTRVSDLAEPGRPLLLVFSQSGCGPCRALAPELATWQRERAAALTVVVVGDGAAADQRAHAQEHGLARVVLDPGDAAAEAYGVRGTPSAVLIDPAGLIVAGPAAGAVAIRALVAEATVGSLPDPVAST